MDSEKVCWCGEPAHKSEAETTNMEEVYRCRKGHRLSRQTALKQAAQAVSFLSFGLFCGEVLDGWSDGS